MCGERFVPSYYEASVSRPAACPPLEGSVEADVCVIGGGFTGVSCALALAGRGFRVAVLEAREVGWGASGRNGGQCLSGFSTGRLRAIAKGAGVDDRVLFEASVAAVRLVKRRIEELAIDCDWRTGTADAAVRPRHFDALRRGAEELSGRYGYPEMTVLGRTRFREVVASRRFVGGVLDDFCGHLHPLKFLLGLAQAARAAGVAFYEGSPATAIDEGTMTVKTPRGEVRCRQVLVAANAYRLHVCSEIAARVMPVGTYIGATTPLGRERCEALIAGRRAVCDTNVALDYFRCSEDERLIFGGRASYTGRPPRDLRRVMWGRMVRVFPQLGDVRFEFVWGGNVAITINRFPDIGRLPNAPVFYAQGFSGHGVAFSGFAGLMIAEAMAGEAERFEVFRRVRHLPFPGGRVFRMPLLVLGMLYYRLRDGLL